MSVFLVGAYSGDIVAEITSYDKKTNRAHFRHANGVEYDRIFLPKAKYNQLDYVLLTEAEMNNAQLAQLRAGYRTRETHREAEG